MSKIAASQEGTDTRIFLGAPFNTANYVVYDQTPEDERGLGYIQIGLATKNTVNNIGKTEYAAATRCSFQNSDSSMSTKAEADCPRTTPDAKPADAAGSKDGGGISFNTIIIILIAVVAVGFILFLLVERRKKQTQQYNALQDKINRRGPGSSQGALSVQGEDLDVD